MQYVILIGILAALVLLAGEIYAPGEKRDP